MSTNIYVDQERTKKHPSYVAEGGNIMVAGEHIYCNDGWHIDGKKSSLWKMPETLRELVIGVSIHEDFSIDPRRERGIYFLETAAAELEIGFQGGKVMKHLVVIHAANLEDARELLKRIKTGSIRPDESFDGEQSGMSREELEIELASLKKRLEYASRQKQEADQDAQTVLCECSATKHKLEGVSRFAKVLSTSKWFSFRATIAKKLNEIIQED